MSDQFGSFSGEVTGLAIGESTEPTGAVDLDNLAAAERESAEPTWSIGLVD